MKHTLFLLLISSTMVLAVPMLQPRAYSGQATFYGGNTSGGHCSFSTYTIPSGIYGTAYANWDNSAHCGACISVTGPSGTKITAMVRSSTLKVQLARGMVFGLWR